MAEVVVGAVEQSEFSCVYSFWRTDYGTLKVVEAAAAAVVAEVLLKSAVVKVQNSKCFRNSLHFSVSVSSSFPLTMLRTP